MYAQAGSCSILPAFRNRRDFTLRSRSKNLLLAVFIMISYRGFLGRLASFGEEV